MGGMSVLELEATAAWVAGVETRRAFIVHCHWYSVQP